MKTSIRNLGGAFLLGALPFTAHLARAQATIEATTDTATTSMGTISEFSPDTIVVRSDTASEPVTYKYTKSTTYVDDSGAPVSMETVKSGLPVTVYYTKEGADIVASKVVVRKAVTAVPATVTTTAPAAASVEETKTTTTTTSSQ